MPQTVEIPDHGVAEFPDDMTPDQIKGVIQQKFYSTPTPSPTPQITEAPKATPEEPTTTQKIISGVNEVANVVQKGQQMALNPVGMLTEKLVPEGVNKFIRTGLVSPETIKPITEASMLPIRGLSTLLFGEEAVREPLGTTEKALSEFASQQTTPEALAIALGTAGVGMADTAAARRLTPKPPSLSETLGFTEKQPEVLQEANAALSDLESKYAQPTIGEPNARQEPIAESVTQPEIRTPVGEETPLRQQGETPEARQGIEAQPQAEEVAPPVPKTEVETTAEPKPEIPSDAKATVKFKTDTGEYVSREMNAKEAEGIFTKEKSSYKALIDCLG